LKSDVPFFILSWSLTSFSFSQLSLSKDPLGPRGLRGSLSPTVLSSSPPLLHAPVSVLKYFIFREPSRGSDSDPLLGVCRTQFLLLLSGCTAMFAQQFGLVFSPHSS